MHTIIRFWRNQSGATAIEYGLNAGPISVVIIVAPKGVGTKARYQVLRGGERAHLSLGPFYFTAASPLGPRSPAGSKSAASLRGRQGPRPTLGV